MAMAEMTKIIATTMSNSISEKPFWFFMRTPGVLTRCDSAQQWRLDPPRLANFITISYLLSSNLVTAERGGSSARRAAAFFWPRAHRRSNNRSSRLDHEPRKGASLDAAYRCPAGPPYTPYAAEARFEQVAV